MTRAQGSKRHVDEAMLLSFEALEQVHWWFVVRRQLILETVHRWAPDPVHRILEVGCGTGGNLASLATVFPDSKVVGVEPVVAAARIAAARGCPVIVGSFDSLPAETESVDLLFALDVLEHLPDDRIGLAEAYRVLRPGGRIIATVPALPFLWGPYDERNEHFRRYTRKSLSAAVCSAGFRPERETYFNMLLLPAAYLERIAERCFRVSTSLGLRLPPRPLNDALRAAFSLELPRLRNHDLPVGMSLLLVATRPVNGKE